ncbi:MAG TPA: hypothetical protein DD662_06435 [Planctomycetaceae bacterium]|nr:hypothetical protein [Planctomycetaceae bacterium]
MGGCISERLLESEWPSTTRLLGLLVFPERDCAPIVLTRRHQVTNRSFFAEAYFHISRQNVKMDKLGYCFLR